MNRLIRIGDGAEPVELSARPADTPDTFIVSWGERSVTVQAWRTADGALVIAREDGRRFEAQVTALGTTAWVTTRDRTVRVEEASTDGGGVEETHGKLEAPMPGKLLRLACAVGDRVTTGQTLVIVEAMKMEHAIKAPTDGVVTEIAAGEGDLVSPGLALVTVEAIEEGADGG